MVYKTLTIEIQQTADFERQVTDEDRPYNPRVSVAISADGETLSGPEKGYTGAYALDLLGNLLDAVPAILDDEKRIITAADGPTYLVFEPKSVDTLRFAKCFDRGSAEDPEQRLKLEPEIEITKEAAVDGILDVVADYIDTVIELNPSLRSNQQFNNLREQREEIEEYLQNRGY